MKIIFKFIKYIIILVLVIIITLFVFLVIVSPGKLEKKKDKNGNVIKNSISEKIKIEINGVEQGMFIVGENRENPILLFLHGGPGSPEYIFFYRYFQNLEKEFTVCYWDQRGSGMSYRFNMKGITLENLIEDTKEVSEYLINTYSKEKIYLLGHSWGTHLGVKTIEKYPELFKAYIGIGQVSNQLESEKLAYKYFMKESIKENDQKTIEALNKYNVENEEFSLSTSYILKYRNRLLEKYGIGSTHENFDSQQMIKDVFFFKGYTAIEKIKTPIGIFKSMKTLWPSVIRDNLMEESLNFEIPIYIIQGKFDYQVSYKLAKDYFELINAPQKEFFTFEESAHCPFYEEPEKFEEVMDKIKLENEKE